MPCCKCPRLSLDKINKPGAFMNRNVFKVFVGVVLFCSKSSFAFPCPWDNPTALVNPDGYVRPKAQLFLPYNYAGLKKKIPLVLSLHGYSGGSKTQSFLFGMDKLVSDPGEEFALLVPVGMADSTSGKDKFWELLPSRDDPGRNDEKYLLQLIDKVKSDYGDLVDPGQIYIFGHSNGGMIGYRMLCDYSNIFSGLVSVAGTFNRSCDRAIERPIKILEVHALDDEKIKYQGGRFSDDIQVNPRDYPSALGSLDPWLALLNCDRERTKVEKKSLLQSSRYLFPEIFNAGSKSDSESITWDSCANGSQISLWSIEKHRYFSPFSGHVPLMSWDGIKNILEFLFRPISRD